MTAAPLSKPTPPPNMAKFKKIRVMGAINGAALGQTNSFSIQRQNRRLEKITLQARVTLGVSGDRTTLTLDSSAYQERISRIFSEVRVRVSDKAGNNRLMVKAPSCTLINWARKMEGALGRHTMTSMVLSTMPALSYDLFVPIFIRHPTLPDLVSNRTCLPLDSGSINDDVKIEMDTIAATPALVGVSGATGGTTGSPTLALNFIRYQLTFREMPADVQYVPQELSATNLINVSAGPMTQKDIPRSGYLSSLLFETYTDQAMTAVGDALSTSTVDQYRLYYGRKDIEGFTAESEQDQDDINGAAQAVTAGATCIPNASGFMLDFLQDRTGEAGYAPDSLINLYTDNLGDSLKIEATSVKINSAIRLTTHKFLTPDLAPLVGL